MAYKDKDINKFAADVYDITEFEKDKHKINGNTYYVLDRKDEKGVNALTLGTKEDYQHVKAGHPEKVNQATVVFRGSEPFETKRDKEYKDVLGEKGKGKFKDEIYQDWWVNDKYYLIDQNKFADGKNNGFRISADYVGLHLKDKFKNATYDVIGHSYGGSAATYTLFEYPDLIRNVYALESPNIYASLSKQQQQAAKDGVYKSRITEYINLADIISLLNRYLDGSEYSTLKVILDPKGDFSANFAKDKNFQEELKKMDLMSLINIYNTGGAHTLSRYTFDKKGKVKEFSLSDYSLDELKEIKTFLEGVGLGQQALPMLLIRGCILEKLALQMENQVQSLVSNLSGKLDELPERVKSEVTQLKGKFVSQTGYGIYDRLNASDAEEFHNEFTIEGENFIKNDAVEAGKEAMVFIQTRSTQYSQDLRNVATEFLKLDRELAKDIEGGI